MTVIEVAASDGSARATPTANGWVVDATPASPATLGALLDRIVEAAGWGGGGRLEYWIEAVRDHPDLAAATAAAGFAPYRDLWQLRCPLPAAPPSRPLSISTRPFEPSDLDDFLAVNNRAFSWHPEQSGRTATDIEAIQSEPWFDPNGFLLHHIDGRLAGFCWTKIHHDSSPPLGEIYIIGVDPDFHGRGLGDALTRAGLSWMHGQGIDHGMLYVESDNDAANRTYERIGFRQYQTNRAFERTVPPAAGLEPSTSS